MILSISLSPFSHSSSFFFVVLLLLLLLGLQAGTKGQPYESTKAYMDGASNRIDQAYETVLLQLSFSEARGVHLDAS